LIVLLLLACANPLSNQLFYEDALFVSALPSRERVGPPSALRVARVGDAALLADAVAVAARLGDATEGLGRTGDALRNSPASVRSSVGRAWDAAQAAGDIDGERVSWWARGEVLQPDAASDLTWVVEVATDPSGPYVPVGEGRHDRDGFGEVSWDGDAFAEVVGVSPTSDLSGSYVDDQPDSPRTLDLSVEGAASVDERWVVQADGVLDWTGAVTVSPDASRGSASVDHRDSGGWGSAELFGATPQVIELCWGPTGDVIYQSGDLGGVGVESDCPFAYPFDMR
jgi:hypothetical protein